MAASAGASTRWADRYTSIDKSWVTFLSTTHAVPPAEFWKLTGHYATAGESDRLFDQLCDVFKVDLRTLPFGAHTKSPEPPAIECPPSPPGAPRADRNRNRNRKRKAGPSFLGRASDDDDKVQWSDDDDDDDVCQRLFAETNTDSPAKRTRSKLKVRKQSHMSLYKRRKYRSETDDDDDDGDDANPDRRPIKLTLRPSRTSLFDSELDDDDDDDDDDNDDDDDEPSVGSAAAAAAPPDDDDDDDDEVSDATATAIPWIPVDNQDLLPEHRGRVFRVKTPINDSTEWSYFFLEDEVARRVRWLYTPAQIVRIAGVPLNSTNALGFTEGDESSADPDSLENQISGAYRDGALVLWWSNHIQEPLDDVKLWQDIDGSTIYKPPFLEGPHTGIVHVVGTLNLDTKTIHHCGAEGAKYNLLEWIAERLVGDFGSSAKWRRWIKESSDPANVSGYKHRWKFTTLGDCDDDYCALCGMIRPLKVCIKARTKHGVCQQRLLGRNCARRIQVAVDLYRNVIFNPEGTPSDGSLNDYLSIAMTALRSGE